MLNKVPWLMSAENTCHQPKRFKTADAAEKLAHPCRRNSDDTTVQDTDKNKKQSKNMYSQELPSRPEMKGTLISRLSSTFWEWVLYSGYRPDAEKLSVECHRIIEYSELQETWTSTQTERQNTPCISESRNKYFYPALRKDLRSVTFPKGPWAPKLSHA